MRDLGALSGAVVSGRGIELSPPAITFRKVEANVTYVATVTVRNTTTRGQRVRFGATGAHFRVEVANDIELAVVPGPRDDWFADADILVRTNWQVTNRSDRVGIRLIGMPLEYRWPDRQLPSEGATRGAIQVPPNGFPVILGPDHPVTGGYPVIGVVVDDDIDRLAQARPGQTVRLHWSRPRHPIDA